MPKYKLGLISPKSNFFFKDELKNNILKHLPGFEVHQRYWRGLGPALPTLAALTDADFEIEIIDENVEEIDYHKNFDIVAVTAMTHQAIRAYQICGEFKKRKIPTVIGGFHSTFLPEEAKQFADVVVLGEAEQSWPVLLNDFRNAKLKDYYNSKDFGETDMLRIPTPRYDLLSNKNYTNIWVNTTRGCPYDCEFCSATAFSGNKHRHKTVEQIYREIQLIKKTFKHMVIGFGDDNMFINRQFTYELLHKFKDLQFNWVAQTDISIGQDEELLKLLFESGCRTLFIGFESLNEANLSSIYDGQGKKLKRDYLHRYEEMVYNIQSHGIGIWAGFIAGLDHDTKDMFKSIIEFAERTKLLGAQFTIYTPLPGTRLRERMIKEQRLLPTSWDNYTFGELNIIPKNITEKELMDGVMDTMQKIFSPENRLRVIRYFKEIMKELIQKDG